MDEFEQVYRIADAILERPNADPDDDQAVLARQFQRTVEKLGICVARGPTPEERQRWHEAVLNALETSAGIVPPDVTTYRSGETAMTEPSASKVPAGAADRPFRVYLIERKPGESREDFEKRRGASVVAPPYASSVPL
jgi:hypothetical protein